MPVTPSGIKIDDGFPTFVGFSLPSATAAGFWEKEVTPLSLMGGGANDTTTMHNITWRTKAPKLLKSAGDTTGLCAYDPEVYEDLVTALNQIQLVTVYFANGDTLAFYGWIDEFKPNSAKEGDQPTATFTVIASNQTATGLEVAPVWTAAP